MTSFTRTYHKISIPLASAEKVPETQAKPPPTKLQRALGVDYGRRFIGIAVSTLGLAPRPLAPIRAGGLEVLMQMAQDVIDAAIREGCDGIVIGLPVTRDGNIRRRQTDSQQGRRCRNFADAVSALGASKGIPVYLVDERGTTMDAENLMYAMGDSRGDVVKKKDSVAAALILSVYFAAPADAVKVGIPKVLRQSKSKPKLQEETLQE